MTDQQHEQTEQRCIVCDSDATVWVNDRLRCTDCGRGMERAPTGDLVRSRTLWWFRRITTGLLVVVLAFNAARAQVIGHGLARLLSVILLVAIVYRDGSDIAEAVRTLTRVGADGG